MKNEVKESNTLRYVIFGDALLKFFQKHLSVIIMLIILMVVYIANGYGVYYIEQQNKKLDKEIKELRAEYVSTQKVLIKQMQYINIKDQIQQRGLGLKELTEPAYTISIDENR